jgi:hypothetical protein
VPRQSLAHGGFEDAKRRYPAGGVSAPRSVKTLVPYAPAMLVSNAVAVGIGAHHAAPSVAR